MEKAGKWMSKLACRFQEVIGIGVDHGIVLKAGGEAEVEAEVEITRAEEGVEAGIEAVDVKTFYFIILVISSI